MPETGLLLQMLVMLLAIGAFAGVLAGLLGVGGGIGCGWWYYPCTGVFLCISGAWV